MVIINNIYKERFINKNIKNRHKHYSYQLIFFYRKFIKYSLDDIKYDRYNFEEEREIIYFNKVSIFLTCYCYRYSKDGNQKFIDNKNRYNIKLKLC